MRRHLSATRAEDAERLLRQRIADVCVSNQEDGALVPGHDGMERPSSVAAGCQDMRDE